MIRPAVFLTRDEVKSIDENLECGETYERDEGLPLVCGPLRKKIAGALRRGERVILCPDQLGMTTRGA